ncbi:MAG: phosphonate metabolism transcriptional regulator PhnF [Pseudomonadota bacterium]
MAGDGRSSSDWRQVYRQLRGRIDEGELMPGDRLPTIAALASGAGITRHAARRALERLRDDGRTRSWQGRGYRVAEPVIDIRLDAFPRWGASTARTGRSGLARLISSRTIRADRALARDMQVRPGAPVYLAELLRSADGRPMALSRSHFPTDRFAGILDDLAETGSVTAALARHGVADCRRSRTRLEARMPSAHEALVIEIPRGQPVMVSTGVNTDLAGETVEISVSVFRADCVGFEF